MLGKYKLTLLCSSLFFPLGFFFTYKLKLISSVKLFLAGISLLFYGILIICASGSSIFNSIAYINFLWIIWLLTQITNDYSFPFQRRIALAAIAWLAWLILFIDHVPLHFPACLMKGGCIFVGIPLKYETTSFSGFQSIIFLCMFIIFFGTGAATLLNVRRHK